MTTTDRPRPMIEDGSAQWHALNRAHNIVANELREQAEWIIERGESPNRIIRDGLAADRDALVAVAALIYFDPAAINAERLKLADRALALPVRDEDGATK